MKYACIIAIVAAMAALAFSPAGAGVSRVRIASTNDAGFAWHVPSGHRLALESAVRINKGGSSWVNVLVDGNQYMRVKLRNGYADLSGVYVRGGAVQVTQGGGKNQRFAIYGRLEVR